MMLSLSYSSQHTFVATRCLGRQKAGEGGLRLPFKPHHRLSADLAENRPDKLGVWSFGPLSNGHPLGGLASCG